MSFMDKDEITINASALLFGTGIMAIVAYVFLRFFITETFAVALASMVEIVVSISLFMAISIGINMIYAIRWKKGKPLWGVFSMVTKYSKQPLNKMNDFAILKEYLLIRLNALPLVVGGYGILTWYLFQPTLFTISFTEAEMLLMIVSILLMVSYTLYIFILAIMLYVDLQSKNKEVELEGNSVNDLVLGIFK